MNEVNKWYVDGVLESNIRNYVRNLIREAMEAGFSVQDLNNALTNDIQGVKDSSDYKDKINYFFENGYKYCVKMLGEPIGKGSARFVFQIDDTRVLKLATNMKGVAQNKSEVMVYQQAPNKTFMPIVYNDSDMENYFYVISEYVLPAEEKDFETVLGVPFYTLVEIFSNYYRGDEIKKYEELFPENKDDRTLDLIRSAVEASTYRVGNRQIIRSEDLLKEGLKEKIKDDYGISYE